LATCGRRSVMVAVWPSMASVGVPACTFFVEARAGGRALQPSGRDPGADGSPRHHVNERAMTRGRCPEIE